MLLLLLGALLAVRVFVAELVVARGSTMAPNVLDGDVLLVARGARPTLGAVVLVEVGDDTAVLRRVLGVAGDRFEVVEGVLHRNGQPLPVRAAGTFTFRVAPGDRAQAGDGPTRRQHQFEETIEGGRAHRVLGDFLGSARPWQFELPTVDVPPGHVFVVCDNRRQCPLDDRLGAVPLEAVRGVARSLVWYGDARADEPPSRPFYGAFIPLESGVASGGSSTGAPRK